MSARCNGASAGRDREEVGEALLETASNCYTDAGCQGRFDVRPERVSGRRNEPCKKPGARRKY